LYPFGLLNSRNLYELQVVLAVIGRVFGMMNAGCLSGIFWANAFSKSAGLANKKIVAGPTICYNFRQSRTDLNNVNQGEGLARKSSQQCCSGN
jgi:hypothetical protein